MWDSLSKQLMQGPLIATQFAFNDNGQHLRDRIVRAWSVEKKEGSELKLPLRTVRTVLPISNPIHNVSDSNASKHFLTYDSI
jgi:hypothetical protein